MILKRSFTALFSVALAVTIHAESPHKNVPRLNRENLLLYRNSSGEGIQGKTRADWQVRRSEILRNAQEVMGPLPGKEKRCPLDIKIEEEVDCGTYVRQLLTYASEPNSRVPAYLLIPKTALEKKAKKIPAVLALHPTDSQVGHKTAVGLSKKENRAYGSELAERGFVVLAPSYPQLANYWPDLKALGYRSGTMKAIWDNKRGLDLLESLPYVDQKRFAAIGHSLGGHNSIYTAVFDDRIKVVVSSCGFDSYLDYMGGDIKGWTSDRYMPALLDYKLAEIPFDFHELVGALAPRPFFVNAPTGDANFKWQSVDKIITAARPVYALYGAADQIQVEHPDVAHDFSPDIRIKAYEFIEAHLSSSKKK